MQFSGTSSHKAMQESEKKYVKGIFLSGQDLFGSCLRFFKMKSPHLLFEHNMTNPSPSDVSNTKDQLHFKFHLEVSKDDPN